MSGRGQSERNSTVPRNKSRRLDAGCRATHWLSRRSLDPVILTQGPEISTSLATRFFSPLPHIVWLSVALVMSVGVERHARSEDWPGFRGTGGSAVSRETDLPQTWSSRENLVWRVALPGPGASSPIVMGGRVFVTSYSGYGVPAAAAVEGATANSADIARLERHLTCFDLATGKQLWTSSIKAEGPDDAYQGFLTEHGYASGTPFADGERVYAFFGKAGVHAFSWDGKPLWKADVGKESSNRRCGTGSSLVMHRDTLIVNASEESQSIRGLDRHSGKELWKASAAALELAYGTPTLTTVAGQTEVAIAADGRLYIPTRWNGVVILSAKPSYELLARNQFDSDESDFNGSVTISGGRVVLRSNRYLYCVGKTL